MKPIESFTVGLCGYLLSLAVHTPIADSRTLTPASTEPSRSEQALNRFEQQLEETLFFTPQLKTPNSKLLTPPPLPQLKTLPPKYIKPAQGILTSGYGWRWGRMHNGIDIAAPIGTPIVAAASGTVQFAGWNPGGYGNLVEILHSDGSVTRYAHNSRLLVSRGDLVEQGQTIALMGSTGNSTGPHLHFEIICPEKGAVNPAIFLAAR